MNKLSEWFKKLVEKWKSFSKKKKIAFGVLFVGILATLIYIGVSLGSTKYGVLFSNMDKTDSSAVYNKLKEKKVDVKVEGNNILVPKDEVDKIRMEVMSEVPLTNGSQGFEILDKNKFGTTEEEMKINYQRALQGELERTIKAFPEVQDSRVHLVLPSDTAFVKDVTPGNAAVTVKLKPEKSLSTEQVKAIVSLVSGSTKNIPKDNVKIIDSNMQELTANLFDEEDKEATTPLEKQHQLKKEYEKNLESKVLNLLEPVYGKGKIQVKINADLDFDAVQRDATDYNTRNVVVSEHSVRDRNTENENGAGVGNDPNQNRIANENNNNAVSTHEENTRNYNVPKVEEKTIKAPGSVNRITTSVIIDGTLDPAERASVNNVVSGAVGFNANRGNGVGDVISVEGMPFDNALENKANKDLEEMKKLEEQKKKKKLYTILGILAVLAIVAGVIIYIKRKKRLEEEEELESQELEFIMPEEESKEETVKFKPIDFEGQNEKTHLENEIKKYAKEKPDQVAEIIKAWLAEDER
ncbi:flagellar M-ring protein [Clostridium acetireducens DSM 10703]|uniref:Flagellar M-ring protein n=1 Tax=Clostridium acetireducens DSM 10703 TaxID=1121290 RepID=A0A1E8F049_9CLOT|nr:flagellar basal-body MS-ring/collar protein FliF [Clostridium acetireducens]OFI06804.1 flagellar M-ring protein [Clostridium acetireducens DSM 10703]